jgi:hypothetical protein
MRISHEVNGARGRIRFTKLEFIPSELLLLNRFD